MEKTSLSSGSAIFAQKNTSSLELMPKNNSTYKNAGMQSITSSVEHATSDITGNDIICPTGLGTKLKLLCTETLGESPKKIQRTAYHNHTSRKNSVQVTQINEHLSTNDNVIGSITQIAQQTIDKELANTAKKNDTLLPINNNEKKRCENARPLTANNRAIEALVEIASKELTDQKKVPAKSVKAKQPRKRNLNPKNASISPAPAPEKKQPYKSTDLEDLIIAEMAGVDFSSQNTASYEEIQGLFNYFLDFERMYHKEIALRKDPNVPEPKDIEWKNHLHDMVDFLLRRVAKDTQDALQSVPEGERDLLKISRLDPILNPTTFKIHALQELKVFLDVPTPWELSGFSIEHYALARPIFDGFSVIQNYAF